MQGKKRLIFPWGSSSCSAALGHFLFGQNRHLGSWLKNV